MPQTYSVLQVTPLPVATIEYVDDLEKENKPGHSYETIGGILFDTKYAWTSNGPRFTLFNTKTGAKVAAWTFGSVLKDSATKVVCIDELRRPAGKLPLLVIGLDCTLTGGMICIFDIAGSRVLRCIQLRDKVTSLHVIDASYDQCPLPGPLRAFDGILSVGTTDGNVLLLDICRQTCEEALGGLGLADIRDEINSCQIKTLFLGDIYSLELHKQVAIKNGEHLCIHLNATNSNNEHFVLKGPKGEDRVHVNKIEVMVSALHYCPQLGSLLVGYNFGAWQLWNLINLQLMYTSPIYEENVPVSHFAIQEPCDDPRSFCYVWAVYSNTNPYETGFPVAVLYSLNYDTKEWHEGYGILYQDLTSCAVRFQTDLTLLGEEEPESKGVKQGAHCLRLQAINKNITKGVLHEHQEETLSLCLMVWSGWSSQSKTGPRTYVSLFDLNQWYKEQMPSSPRLEEFGTYMTRVCLSELLHSVNPEPVPFLDGRIDITTISQFLGSQRLEEHYYPASLAYQLCALRECDITRFNNQGSQRALLADLESGGPLALVKPAELFHLAINLGLSPLYTDVPAKASPSIDYQRHFLLDIALEQQLLGWLCRCASAWSNGSYSAAGCTLHLLLTWGWKRAQVLKQNADKLFTPLFDYSGLRLDANTHRLLSNCARQLKNLATLFEFVVQRFARFLLNSDAVKMQWESLQMVAIHLEVLQWLLNVGLLPECPLSSYPRADEFNRISAPYPVDSLIEYYNQRRTYLQTLNAEQFSTSGSLLFIDNLVDLECGGHKLQKEWENDGGMGFYPPPSLQALLRTYLIENVDISFKHCVTVYVFLDLAMTLDQSRYKSTITHLIKFPAVFHLSPSIIKITQAFWQLDHGDFATAMEQLLDPLVCTDDLKIWHHRVALKALLAQEQHNFALLYLQVRRPAVTEVQDLCTILSLYIANSMLDEAFHFQRRNKSDGNEAKLLRHFYKECDRKGEISSMLYLPLTMSEEKAFIKYLQDVKHPQLKDLQILYYVQNSRFMDAFELNNSLNTIKVENKGLQGQKNVEFRDFILNGLTDTFPKVSKSLMSVCWNERKKSWREVKRPEPFSVFVHNATEQIKYKSTIIQAGLVKAKEIWTHPVLNSNSTSKADASLSVTSEEMPFVNTPMVRHVQARAVTPVIYPKITKLELSQSDDGPSPAKRFKLSPRAPVTSPEMQRSIRIETINSDITCTNLSVRLDTPIINRRTPKKLTSLHLSEEKFSLGTPQSILKIRNLVRNSESPDSAIDTAALENANIASRSSRKLVYSPDVSINTLVRKTSLGLTPRKPLPRTPRPAVRFDISRTPSETSLASTASEPSFEVIQEQAIVHSPIEGVQKMPELVTSQQSGLEVSSGNNSLSAEEAFYTPDASDSNVESKETSQVEGNIESDENKVLHQQVPNMIMTRGRKSLIDESKSHTSRGTYKRQLEDINSSNLSHEVVEACNVDNSLKTEVSQDTPASPKTPRARRSYKGSLPEGGVRSSPRLRKSLIPTESQQLQLIDKNLQLELADVSQEKDISQTQPKESSDSQPLTETVAAPTRAESPIRGSLRGRRSLSRQVLENNALSKPLESVSASLPGKIKSNSSHLEISYSKTETTYESKSTDRMTKESLKISTEEYKDIFTKSKDEDLHTHEESSSVFRKYLVEEAGDDASMFDINSSTLSISGDPANLAYVASASVSGLEESSDKEHSDTVPPVEISRDCSHKSSGILEVEESVGDDPANVAYVASTSTADFEESSKKIIADAVSSVEFSGDHSHGPISILEVEKGVSDDPANAAYVASADASGLEENSYKINLDTVPPVEISVYESVAATQVEERPISETGEDADGGHKLQEDADVFNDKMEVSDNSDENDIKEPENIESTTESDRVEKDVAVNVYDELSSDNYGSADPEMNVFEVSDDLDLNQGMCAASNIGILEIDTNYATSDVDFFADKSDVLSNVIAVNESSLEQFEVTENDELNQTIQEPDDTSSETEVEAKGSQENYMFENNDNVEIIELNSSSDSSEQGPDSEASVNDSLSNSNFDDSDIGTDEQSISDQSDESNKVHSTSESVPAEVQQKIELLSESESSQNADSTSDDYGMESSSSKSSEDENLKETSLEDISEESLDAVTTSGLYVIPEEAEDLNENAQDEDPDILVITTEEILEAIPENNQLDNTPESISNIQIERDQEPVSEITTSSQLNFTSEVNSQLDVTEEETVVQDNQLDIILEETLEVKVDDSHVAPKELEIVVEGEMNESEIPEESCRMISGDQSIITLEETSEIPRDNLLDTILEEPSSVLTGNSQSVLEQISKTTTPESGNIAKDTLQIADNTLHSKNSPSSERTPVLIVKDTRTKTQQAEKDLLNETDILDKTQNIKAIVNTPYKDILDDSIEACSTRSCKNKDWLNQTDVLDATAHKFMLIGDDSDLRLSSTPHTEAAKGTFEKSELRSARVGLNLLNQTDILELDHTTEAQEQHSTGQVESADKGGDFGEGTLKSSTPARRSRRLSSVQPTSTPDLVLQRRTTRRSASFSFSQKISGDAEPSTSKEAASASNSELPTATRKRSNSTNEQEKASVTLPTRGKHSSSTDGQQLPSRKRRIRSASVDVQEKLKKGDVGIIPSARTRRATSVSSDVSAKKDESKISVNKEKIDETGSMRRSNRSSKSESRARPTQSLKPRKSKSTIIVAATKSKLEEYSNTRRLTRRQANLLERTLGTAHVTLEVAHISEHAESDSDDSENHKRGLDIDEIDPIHLLDKSDFEGKPDSDEEKEHQKSPSSSVPESPIGARLRSRSSMSNNSPKSETSTQHSLSESGSVRKQKLQSAKRSIIDPDASISSRTRHRSKSIDETFSSAQAPDKGSPPKLRRTRRNSKDDSISGISQTLSLTDDQKVVTTRRRARSTVEQPVSSPARRSQRQPRGAKSELPKIIEEQPGSVEIHLSKVTTKSDKKN